MTCPSCHAQTTVADTARTPTAIYRRRRCLKCKLRFTIAETLAEVPARVLERHRARLLRLTGANMHEQEASDR